MSNMDPELLVVFVQWLEILGVEKTDLWARLLFPQDCGSDKVHLKWWRTRLGFAPARFLQTVRSAPSSSQNKTKRADFHGTLTLGIHSVDLWNEILGMLDVVSRTGFEPVPLP